MTALWTGGVPAEAVEMSAAFEGFRAAPYRDSGGKWTIGYGSTRDMRGMPVTASTQPVTEAQADEMARRDLALAADLARKAFPGGLPPRWGAVAILTCNNMGDMRSWGPTLLRLMTAGDWPAAADQLRAYRNADGKPETGLRRRRWAEAAYALGMDMAEARRLAWSQINTPDDWPPLPAPVEPAAAAAPHDLQALAARVAALEARLAAMARALA